MANIDDGATDLAGPARRGIPLLLDLAERVLIFAGFVLYFSANLKTHNAANIFIAGADVVTVWFMMIRRPTTNVSLSPTDWLLAIGGTVGPMFARPGGHALVGALPTVLLGMSGLLIVFAAKVSLNRRFGVAPANRGVQAHGAYAFIRHPMYLGYALVNTGYILLNPTWFNAAVLGLTWACQFGRVAREERWLFRDPAYQDYARLVRHRFVPGLI